MKVQKVVITVPGKIMSLEEFMKEIHASIPEDIKALIEKQQPAYVTMDYKDQKDTVATIHRTWNVPEVLEEYKKISKLNEFRAAIEAKGWTLEVTPSNEEL